MELVKNTAKLADLLATNPEQCGITDVDPTTGYTLVHAAVQADEPESLQLLLEAKAQVAQRAATTGDTPLHLSARLGNLTCLRVLLDHSADPNVVNNANETPLHLAAAAEHADIVQELLARGADCSKVDAYRDTPLHVACLVEDCHSVKLLLEAKPELINQQNDDGSSVLHIAASSENSGLLAQLLQSGADFRLLDRNAKAPIDLLTENGDTSSTDCLGRYVIRELRKFCNGEELSTIVSSPEGISYLDNLLHIDGLCCPGRELPTSEDQKRTQLQSLELLLSKRRISAEQLVNELDAAFNSGLRNDIETKGLLSRAARMIDLLVLIPQNEMLLQKLMSNRSLWSTLSRHIELNIDQLYAKSLRKTKAGVGELLRRNCTDESKQAIDFARMNKFLAKLTTYWSFSKRKLMFDAHETCKPSSELSCHKGPMRDPLQSLVIWAILTGRLKLVPMLLRQEEFDLVPLALLATTVLRSLSKRRDVEDVFVDDAGRIASICEGMAIQVLKEVKDVDNSPSNNLTISYVSMPLPNYGDYNILDLSARGCAGKFIKLDIVEQATEKNWYGDFFHFKNGLMRELVIVSGFVPPLMLSLARFIKNQRLPGTRQFLETILTDPDDASSSNEVLARAVVHHKVENSSPQSDATHLQNRENAVGREERTNQQASHAARTRAIEYLKEMLVFYQTPCVKFRLHALFYFLFVIILSYMILNDFEGQTSAAEVFFYLALLGIFIEEIREMVTAKREEALSVYLLDGWNIMDQIALFCGLMAIVTRQLTPKSKRSEFIVTSENIFGDLSYIFIVITTLIFYIRVLFISVVLESVGIKLKMLSLIVKKDFIPFLYILIVIMLGFGIASHALLWPNGEYLSNGKVVEQSGHNILVNMFHRTFYTIFGEYGLDDTKTICNRNATNSDDSEICVDSPGNILVPYVLMVAYIVIVQVLLLNVIVAMFSKTIDMVDSESKSLWLFERYDLNQEFCKRSSLPAPLNILLEIRNVFKWLFAKLGCGCHKLNGGLSRPEILNRNQRNFTYLFYLFYQSVTLRHLRPKLDGMARLDEFSEGEVMTHRQLGDIKKQLKDGTSWMNAKSDEMRERRQLLEQIAADLKRISK